MRLSAGIGRGNCQIHPGERQRREAKRREEKRKEKNNYTDTDNNLARSALARLPGACADCLIALACLAKLRPADGIIALSPARPQSSLRICLVVCIRIEQVDNTQLGPK